MSNEIIWEDPPSLLPRIRWPEIAEALKARPGVWARVAEYNTESAAAVTGAHLRAGRVRGFDPALYQVRQRCPKDGPYYLYAKYIGPTSQTED